MSFRTGCFALISVFVISACNDPKDPQTWIKRLNNPKYATQAVKKLQEIGDPVAVKPLCDLYRQYQSPSILKAIISFKHRDAVPTLIEALDFNEDNYHNATQAAAALAELKATEATPALIKVLQKPLSIRSRANLTKLAAIDALSQLEAKDAVATLIEVAADVPERQDFLLNKRAMEALGDLGDPRAVPVLIRGLFTASTVQGSSFPQARVALVKIGKPAVAPLIAAMQGKNRELNQLADELSIRKGVVVSKTAIVLGDMMAKESVPTLQEQLKTADRTVTRQLAGVIEALGKIGDARAIESLLALLKDKTADVKLKVQACSALPLINNAKAALPLLLELARGQGLASDNLELQQAAMVAYARIVGETATAALAELKAIAKQPKIVSQASAVALVDEAIERALVAEACKEDVACYGNKLTDKGLALAKREKAAIMIGLLPNGRKALAQLTQALPSREPVLRLFFLETAKRIGKASDTALIDTISELAAKDSKRRAKFLGGDLATADKIALAVIRHKR